MIFTLTGVISNSYAQSSVTLYGMVDSGIRYTSNEGGSSKIEQSSGTPNRFGVKGTEDLGGGLSSIFVLENGFNITNGTLGQNGRMFGRQAYVGLSSVRFGAFTIGRQYDSMVDYLQPISAGGHFYAGGLGAHFGDIDNVNNGFRLNNAFKYTSQVYRGFTFGALYSLGGVTGSFRQNSAMSAGASYKTGPVSLAAAYMKVNNPIVASYDGTPPTSVNGFFPTGSPYVGLQDSDQLKTFGAGISYSFGSANLNFLYTNTTLVKSFLAKGDARYQNYETSFQYRFTPDFEIGVAYDHTDGHWSSGNSHPKYDQFNFGAVYSLSKSSRIYAQTVYQRAAGSAKYAEIPLLPAASGNHQLAIQLAFNHSF